MNRRVVVAAAMMVLGLGACAPTDVIQGPGAVRSAGAIAPDAASAAIEAADWEKAIALAIRMRQGDFNPMVVQMRAGFPYVLTIENADAEVHVFRAREFFASAAVKAVEPMDPPLKPGSTVVAILVEPGQTRTVRLIPMKDGTYAYDDGGPGIFVRGEG